MIRHDLTQRLQHAIDALVREGRLPSGLPRAEIADPRDPAHGDFATNFALVASKPAGKNPRELAEMVREAVADVSVFESIEVAGPGFINFRLTPGYIAGWLPNLLAEGEHLAHAAGKSNPNPQRINVEFVSVNPNGPITIGSGRGAAFGSTLCSVLEAAGNTVHREYYINDGVNSEQMRQFAVSVVLSMLDLFRVNTSGREKPYKGDYVLKATEDILGAALVPVIVEHLVQQNGMTTAEYRRYREAVRLVTRHHHDVIHRESGSGALDLIFLSVWCIPYEAWNDRGLYHKFFDRLFVLQDYLSHLNYRFEEPSDLDFLEQQCPDNNLDRVYERFLSDAIVWHLQEMANAPQPPPEVGDTPVALEKYFKSRHSDEAVRIALSRVFADIELASSVFELISAGELAAAGQFPTPLLNEIKEVAEGTMVGRQVLDLAKFNTIFDTWFSEQSLHDRGIVAKDIEALAQKGAADEIPIRHKLKLGKGGVLEDVEIEIQSGATEDEGELNPASGEGENSSPDSPTLWLRSTKFGDDQDRVLKRQDGRLTYIASDVAYHKDKFNRPANADKLITVLGPDHHGYIGRLHAVVAALLMQPSNNPDAAPLTELEAKLYGSPAERDACQAALALSKEKLEVVIFQLVRFMKDGKPAPMRKRDGNIYALIDLVDEIGRTVKPNASKAEQQEVGKDVARFFYLMRSHDTTFDFDLDLAERQSDENPVFYVQYAHARICSVIAKATEAGLTAESNPSLIDHPKELALIKMIADLPYEVSRAAEDYGVHRLATYAIDLARAYHHFYDACRVIQPESPELSKARLALCVATRNALRSTFKLLGISAPERMDREAN